MRPIFWSGERAGPPVSLTTDPRQPLAQDPVHMGARDGGCGEWGVLWLFLAEGSLAAEVRPSLALPRD